MNRLTKRELNNDREPGGAEVLPGTYQLKLIFGDQSSEASIEVKGDPRRTLSMDVLKAKYDAIKALEANQELAVGHVEQLKEKLKIVETLTERMKAKDEKGFEEQIKLSNGHERHTQ